MTTAQESNCPACDQHGSLVIETHIVANPLGTFSIAGAQMKVTARERLVLRCSACGLEITGECDEDGRHATFSSPVLTQLSVPPMTTR